jgi:hypothetical protein
MRVCATRRAVTAGVVVALAVLGSGVTAASPVVDGRLAGLTQITYGCPGPQRVGQPCEHWSAFARARLAVTQNGSDGKPMASTQRVVVSDQKGRFALLLPAGVYTITPLPQTHTRGGRKLTVRLRPGATTRVTIRFLGYPMME